MDNERRPEIRRATAVRADVLDRLHRGVRSPGEVGSHHGGRRRSVHRTLHRRVHHLGDGRAGSDSHRRAGAMNTRGSLDRLHGAAIRA